MEACPLSFQMASSQVVMDSSRHVREKIFKIALPPYSTASIIGSEALESTDWQQLTSLAPILCPTECPQHTSRAPISQKFTRESAVHSLHLPTEVFWHYRHTIHISQLLSRSWDH